MQRREFLLGLGGGLSLFSPLANAVTISSPVETLQDRPPIPDFALSDLQGRVHRPADYQDKVLLVNFWATWCPPCRAEMPSMERMLEHFKGAPLALIAIAMGQSEKQVRAYSEEHPHPFPLLPDVDGRVSEVFGVTGLPTSFLSNQAGRLVFRVEGGRQWDSERMLRTISLLLPEQ